MDILFVCVYVFACVYVPVAQWIERFPAEEEVSRSSRLRDTSLRSL